MVIRTFGFRGDTTIFHRFQKPVRIRFSTDLPESLVGSTLRPKSRSIHSDILRRMSGAIHWMLHNLLRLSLDPVVNTL